jgi:glycosyltransferase involved in cell wall biosynthesis
MKIAVYTIALNEEQFVEKWVSSAKEADYLIVGDTGSTDATVAKLKALGVVVHIITVSPWRFDIARNSLLSLIPADVDLCISLDMDEVLSPDWRSELEKASVQNSAATRFRYNYVWKFKPDGKTKEVEFVTDKIHSRKNYFWKYPCHETLTYSGEGQEVYADSSIGIFHYPDITKSRGSYLKLLELGCSEYPTDDRMCFYYARELFFQQQFEIASNYFHSYLSLHSAVWKRERAEAYIYLGKCARALSKDSTIYFQRSLREEHNPSALLNLALNKYLEQKYEAAKASIEECLSTEENATYMSDVELKSALPYDILSMCNFYLKDFAGALKAVNTAIEIEPTNLRLQTNKGFFQ